MRDYRSNVTLYPQIHGYLRESQVPVLAVWGRDDGIFQSEGARAFRDDTPYADVHLLAGGHFLLESALDEVADLCSQFLERIPVAAVA